MSCNNEYNFRKAKAEHIAECNRCVAYHVCTLAKDGYICDCFEWK